LRWGRPRACLNTVSPSYPYLLHATLMAHFRAERCVSGSKFYFTVNTVRDAQSFTHSNSINHVARRRAIYASSRLLRSDVHLCQPLPQSCSSLLLSLILPLLSSRAHGASVCFTRLYQHRARVLGQLRDDWGFGPPLFYATKRRGRLAAVSFPPHG
jgi:hypothetical protein